MLIICAEELLAPTPVDDNQAQAFQARHLILHRT